MNAQLLETIALTYAYYNPGQVLSNTVVAMYADDLGDLAPEECVVGYRKYRLNPKNSRFPLPAQIRSIVKPEENISAEAEAREIAARICGAIPKYGWCNPNEARKFIGPTGWMIVERQGGWQHLCEHMGIGINPSTFQAQVRDQIAAHIQYGPALDAKVLAMPTTHKNELQSAGSIIKQFLPSPEDEPK